MNARVRNIVGHGGGGKAGGGARTPVESPDSLHSIAYARILDLVSEGEIVGLANGLQSVFLDETPLANPDGTLNFKNVQIDSRTGTQDQIPILGFPEVESEIGVGVPLVYGTPYVKAFTNLDLDAVRIRISVPSLSQTSTSTGDTSGAAVNYRIAISIDGGAYTDIYYGSFIGKTSSKFERSHRIDLPKPATVGWSLRVTRLTPDSVSLSLQNQTVIESVTEIVDVKLTYPNSALVGVIVDASQFRSIPRRGYDLIGRIVRVPSNYNPATRKYTGTWDGTFQPAWTDNPAWIYHDLATHSRYGLGHLVGDSQVDKWALYEIGQYCDGYVPTGLKKRAAVTTGSISLSSQSVTNTVTRATGSFITDGFAVGDEVALAGFATAGNNGRAVITAVTATVLTFGSSVALAADTAASGRSVTTQDPTEIRLTCNIYLQRQADAFKVLQDLASVFRGMSYWANNKIVPTADKPEDAVYTYSNANVVDGKFKYSGTGRKARHSVALVSWSDPSDFGRGKVEYVQDKDSIARYGIQPVSITAIGCTSQGMAHRVGKWALLTERLETDTVSFSVALEGTVATPGQIVMIADQKRAGRRIGGRVSSATTTVVTVDAVPSTVPVPGDMLTVVMPTGVTETRAIASVAGKALTVSPAFSAVAVKAAAWAIETSALKTQLFRVLNVTEGDKLSFALTCLQHNASKFDAVEQGLEIQVPVVTDLPAKVQARPTNVALDYEHRAGHVIASTVVVATWDDAVGATSYKVQWRRDSGDWTPEQKVTAPLAELVNAFPGTYQARVWAQNSMGLTSGVVITDELVVPDQTLTPGFYDDLNAAITTALTAANNAQATADGAVVSFWTTTPPTIGSGVGQASVGDIWFDTDDGNKIYRVVGSSWVLAADDDMAAALAAASTAQSTADGKITTYFNATSPTPPGGGFALGDLWFNSTLSQLFRWNGSAWAQNIGDVTLAQLGGNGTNILWEEYAVYDYTALPVLFGLTNATSSRNTSSPLTTDLASLQMVRTSATSSAFHLGSDPATAANRNVLLGGTKKYIVSFYVYSSVAAPNLSFHLGDGTTYYGGTVTTTGMATSTWTRVSIFVDASAASAIALTGRVTMGTNTASQTLKFTRFMIEATIGTVQTPSAWAPGAAGRQALLALTNAALAQSTADGKIDSFFQTTAPAGTAYGVGDLWFDTDDGNKQYNWNGSSWVLSADTRIGTAISAAAGAQATADGKVKTFFQASTSTPTASAVGDLWVQTDTFFVLRWSGSAWTLVGATLNSTTVQNGVVLPYGFGDELVSNGNFETNASSTRKTTLVEYAPGTDICDGWRVRYNGGVGLACGVETTTTGDNGICSLFIGLITPRTIAAGQELRTDVKMAQMIPVKGKERFLFSGFIKWDASIAVPAGITATASIFAYWYDSAGSAISAETFDSAYGTIKRFSRAITAPDNAASVEIFCLVSLNNSTGAGIAVAYTPVHGRFDSISLKRLSFTGNNPNLLVNSDFTNGNTSWSGSPTIFKAGEEGYQGRSGALTSGSQVFYYQAVSLAPAAGETFTFAVDAFMAGTLDSSSLINAYIEYLDVTGTTTLATTPHDTVTSATQTGNYKRLVTSGPCPSGTGYIRCVVWMRGAYTGGLGIFRRPKLERGPIDTAYTAGVEQVYGQEIVIPGSGRQIGDQRNLLPVGVGSLISRVDGLTPTYTFTTATPAVVTVNLTSCTLRIGSTSVSYSSSSANVNQTRNTTVTYYAYYLDLSYAGGSKTLNLTTDPNVLVNSNDVVYIASFAVTVPAAATGGGGGGSGCPSVDSLVRMWDGTVKRAGDVEVDDYITVVDEQTLACRPGRVTYSMPRLAETYHLATNSGAELVCSRSAPIPTRHGLVLAPLAVEHETPTCVDDVLTWSTVTLAEHVGTGMVQHITCEDSCFLVGTTEGSYMVHHNAKPPPP